MMELLTPSLRRCALARPFWSLAVFIATSSVAATALADAPRVHFDVPYIIAARDITPADFDKTYPHDKLVELKLEVSSLLQEGSEADLRQYLYRIVSSQQTMTVIDYLPKTLHETALAGNLKVEKSDERTASIGVNVSGKYEATPEAGFNSGVGEKKTSCVRFEMLPPLESVTASGTVLRGSGVYFKLKASDRNLLEGAREVAMTVRVPKAWRADYLHVRCEADGYSRSVVRSLDTVVSCGERDFLVVVYLEGDEEARSLAHEMVRRELELRRVAAAYQARTSQRPPSLGKILAIPSSTAKAPLPSDWLGPFIYAGARGANTSKFPADLRQAADDYQAARLAITRLNGWSKSELAAAASESPRR